MVRIDPRVSPRSPSGAKWEQCDDDGDDDNDDGGSGKGYGLAVTF